MIARSGALMFAAGLVLVASPARAQTVGDVLHTGSCDRPSDIMPLAWQITETHFCRFPGDLESWSHLGHERINGWSPAILLDGRDVEGAELGSASCCRVYVGPDGARLAAPSVEAIAAALLAHSRSPR